ncbi:MAG: NAD-dependent epimerase/dehydratase family protein, partial [Armatimonadia bacterium]|nr:NAD-dependent epimerase/dehydratase family protein [Armatimonadia bacterium]
TLGAPDLLSGDLSACPPCEAIVHAAAHISYDDADPEIARTNCVGVQQMLGLAERWGTRLLLGISSIGVIGAPEAYPIAEDHPVAPPTAYHASKLFSEHVLSLAGDESRPAASLRITSPVGKGMPGGRILSVFVDRCLREQPLTLAGRGTRRQNYVDVRDVARAVSRWLHQPSQGVYNVGGDGCTSNADLARECVRVTGSGSEIIFEGTDPAEGQVWDVSSAAASAAFGYEPECTLTSAIEEVARGIAGRTD